MEWRRRDVLSLTKERREREATLLARPTAAAATTLPPRTGLPVITHRRMDDECLQTSIRQVGRPGDADQSQLLATKSPCEGHDVFIRLPPDRRVRIRSTADELRLNVHTCSCIKTRVCELVVRTDRPDGLAFKVALSTENPVPVKELGQFAETEFFRIRQTRRFTYGSSGGEDWAYTTSRWSDRAATACEQRERLLEQCAQPRP
eukprot:scaffold3262_cov109-Isochrysis_galbana.AAC.8